MYLGDEGCILCYGSRIEMSRGQEIQGDAVVVKETANKDEGGSGFEGVKGVIRGGFHSLKENGRI